MARAYFELGDGQGVVLRALVGLTVHVSWRAALVVARRIRSPWYRTQSLAKVLQHAPDAELERIEGLAFASAALGSDTYQRTCVRVWIVEALFVRGEPERAARVARGVIADLPHIEHGGSRSEVKWLLAWKLRGNDLALERELAEVAARAATVDSHWRTKRAALRCVCSLVSRDRTAVERFAALVEDPKTRRLILRHLARSA